MNCWCCIRRPVPATSNKDIIDIEKRDCEEMINDFLSTVCADAVKRASDQHGIPCNGTEDDKVPDNSDEVTGDVTQMVSRLDLDLETARPDDSPVREKVVDSEMKQRISQVLDMGVHQPGISIAGSESDLNSEVDSESGSVAFSPKHSSWSESCDAVHDMNTSVVRKRLSMVSYPSLSSSVQSSKAIRRTVSLEHDGNPGKQKQRSVDAIKEDARAMLQEMMDRASLKVISQEQLSTCFLDNAR